MRGIEASVAAGSALGVLVLCAAGLLAWLQFRDRGRRDRLEQVDELLYFRRQDMRRYAGAVLMAVAAIAIGLGSRIDPRVGDSSRRWFVSIWFVVCMLILALVAVAFRDWYAIAAYARRRRAAIVRERERVIAEFQARKRNLPEEDRAATNGFY